MIINDKHTTDHTSSDEGTTQRDVTAMAVYALGVKPLIDTLAEKVEPDDCKQVWYADDNTTAGSLTGLKKWCNVLDEAGPKYDYFPKPCKSMLILKSPYLQQDASKIFEGSGVKIEIDRERHLGAVIGSEKYRKEYVSSSR